MMSRVEEGGAGVNHRISSGQKMGRQLSLALNELKAGVQEWLDESGPDRGGHECKIFGRETAGHNSV